MANTKAMTRMPTHQARAIQMSSPTGCCSNKALIVLTIEVTGWFSAKARTGPGIEAVGTNAELMNGRKMSGYAKAAAPSTDFADNPAMHGDPGQREREQGEDAGHGEPRQHSRRRAEAHEERHQDDDDHGDPIGHQ